MKINILDIPEPKLKDVLPSGHKLDLVSRVTLLVGENGRGKTAFLKLLNSSLLNNLYFERWKTSAFWREHNIDYKEELQRDIPLNRWGYFVVENNLPLYPFFFESQDADFRSKPRGRTDTIYCGFHRNHDVDTFNPQSMFDPNTRCARPSDYVSPGSERRKLVISAINSIDKFYQKRTDHIVIADKKDHSRTIEFFLEQGRPIDEFVINYGVPREIIEPVVISRRCDLRVWSIFFLEREPWDMKLKIQFGTKLFSSYEPHTVIPEHAQALLLLDEPTAFMSYRGKYLFLNDIAELVRKYSGLNVCVATNDAVLIENKDKCWGAINFDEEPVQYKTEINKPLVK